MAQNPYEPAKTELAELQDEPSMAATQTLPLRLLFAVSAALAIVLSWFSVSMFFLYPLVSLTLLFFVSRIPQAKRPAFLLVVATLFHLLPVIAIRSQILGSVYETPLNLLGIY